MNDKPFEVKSRITTEYIIDSQNKINSNINPQDLPQVEEQQFFTINVKGGNNSKKKISSHISPSKVISFWQPAFNNTLLATREFEKRMASIHNTCDDKVLDVYTNNITKSMCEIDEMVATMGYSNFNDFAAEQVGPLNRGNAHAKGLQHFYENEMKKLKRIVAINAKHQQKLRKRWDDEVNHERSKEQNRSSNRASKNYKEEYDFNLDNVYRQLGLEKKKTQVLFGKSIGFTVNQAGVYNIDKYVADATIKRKSTVIVDQTTGKTAKITYNAFSFEVNEAKNYGKLYAYLFPSQLNSYQRISGQDGKFNYPLNGDIEYHLAVIGVSEKGYFYCEKRNLNKGDLRKLDLTGISETDFNQKITALNESRGIVKPMVIIDELQWLVKEQKNYTEQKRRKDETKFRGMIRGIIFPCEDGTAVSAIGLQQ